MIKLAVIYRRPGATIDRGGERIHTRENETKNQTRRNGTRRSERQREAARSNKISPSIDLASTSYDVGANERDDRHWGAYRRDDRLWGAGR